MVKRQRPLNQDKFTPYWAIFVLAPSECSKWYALHLGGACFFWLSSTVWFYFRWSLYFKWSPDCPCDLSCPDMVAICWLCAGAGWNFSFSSGASAVAVLETHFLLLLWLFLGHPSCLDNLFVMFFNASTMSVWVLSGRCFMTNLWNVWSCK